MNRLLAFLFMPCALLAVSCVSSGDYYYSDYGPERHVSSVVTTMYEIFVHDDVHRPYGMVLCKERNNGKNVEYYLFAPRRSSAFLGNEPISQLYNFKTAIPLNQAHIMSILDFTDTAIAAWTDKVSTHQYGSYTVVRVLASGRTVEMLLSYKLSGSDQSFSINMRDEPEILINSKEELNEFRHLLSSALVPVLAPKKKRYINSTADKAIDDDEQIQREKEEIERLKSEKKKSAK